MPVGGIKEEPFFVPNATGTEIAVAVMAEIEGQRIWFPPIGKPYFCSSQPVQPLTDDEIAKFTPMLSFQPGVFVRTEAK